MLSAHSGGVLVVQHTSIGQDTSEWPWSEPMERSSAIIDSSLSKIRLFLIRDLVGSLSGRDGRFEPQRDWRLIVDNVARIQAVDHQLPKVQKAALDDLVSVLQLNLNGIVSILTNAVENGGGGTTATPEVVARLDSAMLKVREDFERSARAFYELLPVTDQSRVVQFFLGEVHMSGDIIQGISNSTVIVKSKVEGAFNRLQDSGQSESAKLLIEIGKRVSDANNPAAGAVYNQMADEISKPTHDKGVIKSCWDGLVAILPPLASLSAEVIKAFAT
jgi:hypothetical protein